MARPPKQRCIRCAPVSDYFKPRGVPLHALDEIALELDELEALRLADLDGHYQTEVALRMGVSRQTIGNILARARHKIADALLNGKALRISSTSQGEAQRPPHPPTGEDLVERAAITGPSPVDLTQVLKAMP
ncbi:DUF134 domain-containing protein [Uliginosibacterium sp. 31-12]|uniref:DUF134 domain-containing protein n=1 Tax=Uliginosibacterium sp. 31-12 TaxID=3062781 RepID=UPI0026E20024|nr:DUF134 domain-containing protein [Uliginosibacterium sp. 31-12]MDO6387207.1 DUF134 domain-containing protein [Uliginosibacterium sp. 31-12]